MKTVLLIGLGRFGNNVAKELNNLGHEVMAIDKSEEKVQENLEYVTSAQIGDSTNIDFLKSLGVNNFDLCIVTIAGDFQSSLETTSLLKELGARMVVSRAETDIHEKFLLRNGADAVVFPEKQIAGWTAAKYTSNHILEYTELSDNCVIVEAIIPKEWEGRTVGEIDVRKKHKVNIIAIKKNEVLDTNVHIDTVLEKGKVLLVLGNEEDIRKCFK